MGLALSLMACTSSDSNQITLSHGYTFATTSDEIVVPNSPEILADYESLFDRSRVNAPLYKCIEGKDYRIFLGLVYDQDAEEISPEWLIGDREQMESNSEVVLSKGGEEAFSCAQVVPLDQSSVLAIISSDSENVVQNVCDRTRFGERMNKTK